MPCASTAYVLFIVWHCSLPALIISYLGYNINRCIFDCLHGIITIYYTQKIVREALMNFLFTGTVLSNIIEITAHILVILCAVKYLRKH